MTKIKAKHLQEKDKEELLMQMDGQKLEQAQGHVVKVLGEHYLKLQDRFGLQILSQSCGWTSQHQKESFRTFYKDRKHKPLEQGPKMAYGWQHTCNEHKGSLRLKTINKRNKKLCQIQTFTVGS